ncbi:hypothetical protein [Mongoliitalea daihaiensis]|uniref:hypothetical protein n=1 Tax=Mongoliitalea daihaiensis TaxID=2782006 RepID=UPI001F1D1098|nr:hypothetical protein [Mongoliitalea daihaiensis]UJP63771.1 hypothetical protein IPZ59_13140 [Mongoliitalea daihaiensis]
MSQVAKSIVYPQLSVQSTSQVEQVTTLADWFHSCAWIQVDSTGSFSFPNFPEKKEVFQVFYCSVKESKIKHLLKTILSLGGLSGKLIDYQKENDSFIFRLYKHEEQALLIQLKRIENYLSKELRFKRVLAQVIFNERKHRAQERLLRNELF